MDLSRATVAGNKTNPIGGLSRSIGKCRAYHGGYADWSTGQRL